MKVRAQNKGKLEYDKGTKVLRYSWKTPHLASLLSHRTQTTCGCKWNIFRLVSRVIWGPPRDSSGPVLFLLYINDLPNSISSTVKLFADDSVVYRQIQRVEDHSILQQDLFNLEQWASLWQMNFAPSKCYTLSVTLKKEPSLFTYSLCKSILEGVKFQKYLGVYITSSLSWAKQCEAVKKKANRVLGVLQRSLSSCSESVKERAYVGLVRPIAEYASAAWSPHTKKDTNNIESIQRRAA